MILMVDNYDSFTYNLVHLFEELGGRRRTWSSHPAPAVRATPESRWS